MKITLTTSNSSLGKTFKYSIKTASYKEPSFSLTNRPTTCSSTISSQPMCQLTLSRTSLKEIAVIWKGLPQLNQLLIECPWPYRQAVVTKSSVYQMTGKAQTWLLSRRVLLMWQLRIRESLLQGVNHWVHSIEDQDKRRESWTAIILTGCNLLTE